MTLAARIAQAAAEVSAGAAATNPGELAAIVDALVTARRIATFGCGREGLMMRALTMRLYHLGLDVHYVGDVTCPPLGRGDLLLVCSGPGSLSTVAALIGQARAARAQIACITADAAAPDPTACDHILTIPAQTMVNDQTATTLLPMGSIFEGALFLVSEILVLTLRDRLHETAATMRARHTNLE